MEPEHLTLSLASIIILGVATQWVSSNLRVPSILLLLIAGIVGGPVLGLIHPQETLGSLLVPITSLSIAIILFEGGLSLRFREVKEVGHIIRNIVTLGAAGGFLLTFCFLYYFLNFSFTFSLLQSGILMITGPTVITPMLNQLHIKQPVRSILRWEGIIIDPIGALTAVIIFEGLIHSSTGGVFGTIFSGAILAICIGIIFGGLGALAILYSLRKFWIPDILHSPVTCMFVILVFSGSNFFQADSGLLSVTLMGMILANQNKTKVSHIIDFQENLTVILISFLFIVLAGIMNLERLKETAVVSSLLVLFLITVTRPLTVFLSGAFKTLPKKQALFMCLLAPRGIVTAVIASLFGLSLEKVGYADAPYFVPVTFTVIGGTVAFYSIFTPIAAHFLGLSAEKERGVLIIGANPVARAIGRALDDAGLEVHLIDPNYWKVAETKKSTLPVYRGTFLAFEKELPEKFDEMNLLLAMTENDDINSLAVIHLRNHFEESELYQLPTAAAKIHESLMGQQLFNDELDYHTLSLMLNEGYAVKSTTLSSEFGYNDLKKEYQNQSLIPLFYIQKSGIVLPFTKEAKITPGAGGTVIFMYLAT